MKRAATDEHIGSSRSAPKQYRDDTTSSQDFRRNPANQFHFSEQRFLLKFKYKFLQPVWTGTPLENEMGTLIEIELVDRLTGTIINFGPEASLKVEIVVLEGDDENDREFDCEGFERSIVRKGVGNKSLLDRDVFLDLKEGIGFSGEIKFSHGFTWMKNRRYRLGARVVDNIYSNRVGAAVSESIEIRDRRMQLYVKPEIPSLSDEVWRLKNISRRGACYMRLKENNISTVEEFLNEFNTNPQNLKKILTDMSDKKWEALVSHARRCVVDATMSYEETFSPATSMCSFSTVEGEFLMPVDAYYGDSVVFQLYVSSEIDDLREQVSERLNLENGTYSIMYQDEENDWVLIECDDDVHEYISYSTRLEVYTLFIKLKDP